jgi:glycosyltransferase involved in cell wall biosynthesis
MNIIFLRGAVPPKSEHPEKLLYNQIEDCEDMWTQLFYYLLKSLGAKGELLYQGGNRKFVIDNMFTERWVPSFNKYKPKRKPDLIICRGGFKYYDCINKRFPKAKKVYYGAGARFYPTTGYEKYDLFLTDSNAQLIKIRKKGKNVALFIKPAATLFKPFKTKKKFDICFIANAAQARIKRHKLFLQSFAKSKLSILNLGGTNKKLVALARKLGVNIKWDGWSLRKNLPQKISKCRVGVCCSTNYDSCPRVIPEYLACGVPIVATKNMNFWHDKYIVPGTGLLVREDRLLHGVKKLLNVDVDVVADCYNNRLSMNPAVAYLAELLEPILR